MVASLPFHKLSHNRSNCQWPVDGADVDIDGNGLIVSKLIIRIVGGNKICTTYTGHPGLQYLMVSRNSFPLSRAQNTAS